MQFGDFVTLNTLAHSGCRGRVYYRYDNMIQMGWDDPMLATQERTLGPAPMRFANGIWLAVLVHRTNIRRNYDVAYVPDALVRSTEPFELNNAYSTSYFSDTDRYRGLTGGEESGEQTQRRARYTVGSTFRATQGGHYDEVFTIDVVDDSGYYVCARPTDPCGGSRHHITARELERRMPEWINA